MKQYLFLAFLFSLAVLVAVWPAQLSTAQIKSDTLPAATTIALDSLAERESAAESKFDSGKAAIYKEIARIKNSKPRVVIRHQVRTVYKDVPSVIFIDTCLTKIKPAEPLPAPVDIYFPPPEPHDPFFKRLFKKIFHGRN